MPKYLARVVCRLSSHQRSHVGEPETGPGKAERASSAVDQTRQAISGYRPATRHHLKSWKTGVSPDHGFLYAEHLKTDHGFEGDGIHLRTETPPLGWSNFFSTRIPLEALDRVRPARVVRVERDRYGVDAGAGEFLATLTGRFRHEHEGEALPTVGDWVLLARRVAGQDRSRA